MTLTWSQELILWFVGNEALIGLIYTVLLVFAVWHCMADEQGIDRLTWIVVILFLPLFGMLLYGAHAWSKPVQET